MQIIQKQPTSAVWLLTRLNWTLYPNSKYTSGSSSPPVRLLLVYILFHTPASPIWNPDSCSFSPASTSLCTPAPSTDAVREDQFSRHNIRYLTIPCIPFDNLSILPFSFSYPSPIFPSVLTDCWSLALMVLTLSGSQMTMSASDPTAIRPLRGYRLKIFAALVDVTATNWFSSIFPIALGRGREVAVKRLTSHSQLHTATHRHRCSFLTTALSQTKPILSSTPLVPSGIRVKSSLPIAFWEVLYVQWALPTTWRSPLHQGNKIIWDCQYITVWLTCQIVLY